MEEDMTERERVTTEVAARLRAKVQRWLGNGPDLDLSPLEQLLLLGWYEREIGRLQELVEAMVSLAVDDATAARYRVEATLARAGGNLPSWDAPLWDFRTGTPLDADEGPAPP